MTIRVTDIGVRLREASVRRCTQWTGVLRASAAPNRILTVHRYGSPPFMVIQHLVLAQDRSCYRRPLICKQSLAYVFMVGVVRALDCTAATTNTDPRWDERGRGRCRPGDSARRRQAWPVRPTSYAELTRKAHR
jgi:hypothetical protein